MSRSRITGLMVLLAGWLSVSQAQKVYVFFPSMLRPNAIQSALSAKCPGMEITVFGRLADFNATVGSAPPDGVVALGPIVEGLAGFKTVLKGVAKGATSEPLVLLSVGKPVDLGTIAKLNIGVVGFLERAKLASLVNSAVKGAPKLKNVTKVEDLLPLLTFQNADAVLVNESVVAELKGKSQASLVVTKLDARLDNVVVAARGNAASKIESAFKSLGASEKKILGVDAWTK